MFQRPLLPQEDQKNSERTKALESQRKIYYWNRDFIPGFALAAEYGELDKPSTPWKAKVLFDSYQSRRNFEKILDEHSYNFQKELPQQTPQWILKQVLAGDLAALFAYFRPDLGVIEPDGRPSSKKSYDELFKIFELPESAANFMEDEAFVEGFLSGLNPVLISRVKTLDGGFPFANVELPTTIVNDSLESAFNEGRLFEADYQVIADLRSGRHPQQDKYTYAPRVLFLKPRNQSKLRVIAIQCENSPEAPIYKPDQSWDWQIAKLIVRVADSIHHEVVSHLGHTHLMLDPIVVATRRQLAANHPLSVLLNPHFEGTLPINSLGVKRLLPRGGLVEQILGCDIDSVYEQWLKIRKQKKFRDLALGKDLQERGVDTQSQLGAYAYRDDALLLWKAIAEWVRSYVKLYYQADAQVLEDQELQAWVREINDPDAGQLTGFASGDGVYSVEELNETLTLIIFLASVQHAAINFSQKSDAAYVPAYPLAGFQPAPKGFGATEKDWLSYLPPIDTAIKQIHTLLFLGGIYETQLGQYKLGTFEDKRVVPHLFHFQGALKKIEGEIQERNKKRSRAYVHLLPSRIPQSINI